MWHLNGKLIKAKGLTINDIQYPAQIFSKWSETELNNIGIYSINDVRVGTLADNTWEWSEPVIDFNVNTRTYTAQQLPQEKIDRQAAKKLAREIANVKEYANQDIIKAHQTWKQLNMLGAGLMEVVDMLVDKGVITRADFNARPKVATLLTKWKAINDRRKLSDQHEADLTNGVKTMEDITNELYPPEPIV